METKELKVVVPEGYEIDREKSTFDCIKFRPITSTYEDIANILFNEDKKSYVPRPSGLIDRVHYLHNVGSCNFFNCVSEKQAKKLMAISKMMNVAKFLNGDWTPDWNNMEEYKWQIELNHKGEICIDYYYSLVYSFVFFKSKECAERAIDILGEETIKLALSSDW